MREGADVSSKRNSSSAFGAIWRTSAMSNKVSSEIWVLILGASMLEMRVLLKSTASASAIWLKFLSFR